MEKKRENKKLLSNRNVLLLIDDLVGGDAGFTADEVELAILNGEQVTEREKTMAKLIHRIYRAIHSIFHCNHTDWQEETRTRVKLMKQGYNVPL